MTRTALLLDLGALLLAFRVLALGALALLGLETLLRPGLESLPRLGREPLPQPGREPLLGLEPMPPTALRLAAGGEALEWRVFRCGSALPLVRVMLEPMPLTILRSAAGGEALEWRALWGLRHG